MGVAKQVGINRFSAWFQVVIIIPLIQKIKCLILQAEQQISHTLRVFYLQCKVAGCL